jgi:hypothetical protein
MARRLDGNGAVDTRGERKLNKAKKRGDGVGTPLATTGTRACA